MRRSGTPWSFAYSSAVIQRTRKPPRPASTTACLLDPPLVVRRHPLIPSPRISHTGLPNRVRLYVVAQVRRSAFSIFPKRSAWILDNEIRNDRDRPGSHQRG